MASSVVGDRAVRKSNPDSPLPGLKQYPWESRFQWLCRRRFAEAHKERYGMEKAITLSLVWANVNFLGCQYSNKTTSLVSHYPVPESDDMKRWVGARGDILDEQRPALAARPQDVASATQRSQKRNFSQSLASETSSAKIAREDATVELSTSTLLTTRSESKESGSSSSASFDTLTRHLDALISTYRKQNEEGDGASPVPSQPYALAAAPSSYKPTVVENSAHVGKWLDLLARNVCLCDQCEPEGKHPVTTVINITQKVQAGVEFSFGELPGGAHVADVQVEGVAMSRGVDPVKKTAKMKAAQALIADVAARQDHYGRPPCPIANRRVAHASLPHLSGAPQAADKIPDDNKGSQMLRRMGWSGEGGLGRSGKGRLEPVAALLEDQGGRVGLGGRRTSSLSSAAIRDQLSSFLRSEDNELMFPADLSPADREAIHSISQQYGLFHKSYGVGSERHLVVRKKEPALRRGMGLL